MDKLIQNIGDYVDEALGIDQSSYGQLPDTPDNVINFNPRSGIPPKYSLGKGEGFMRRPFLEVRVRNEDYFEGLGIAENVRAELERLYGHLGNHYIVSITATSEVLENGRDTDNRYNFIANYNVKFTKEEI